MIATHTAELDLPNLPLEARTAHIFPELGNTSLLSVGQLCDAQCTATFTNKDLTITHNNETVLHGTRTTPDNLWHATLPHAQHTSESNPWIRVQNKKQKQTTQRANNVNHTQKATELVAFAHGSFFSPAISTLQQALNKNYISHVPGLTAETLRKHPPQSVASIKGHLDQSRKNQRSTKEPKASSEEVSPPETDNPSPESPLYTTDSDTTDEQHIQEDFWPTKDTNNDKTHHCFATHIDDPTTGKIFTDQTGRFVIPSSTGNTQIFILYDYDSNSIHAEPIKNRTAPEILRAFKTVHQTLTQAGLRPKIQRMDNECSNLLADYFKKEKIDYQLVPAGQHRRNAAEHAIRTFKNHLIAGLCTTDSNFPLHLWDRLLQQAVLTLNLMHGSRVNPNLSAWAQVFGNYDFNRTPIAPPGIRVLVHEKPENRNTWAPHAVEGWYVGPALQSYRCYRTWITETKRERTADTLTWLPEKLKLPTALAAEIIASATTDILHALQHPDKGNPFLPLNDTETETLKQITTLLHNKTYNDNTTEQPAAPPNTDNTAPAPDLRVPATEPENIHLTDTPHLTYLNTSKPKKRCNRAKTAANPDTIQNVAMYTTHLLKNVTTDTNHACYSAIHPDTGLPAEYRDLRTSSEGAEWIIKTADEIGCLVQGNSDTAIEGTNTMFFIHRNKIPNGRKPTYLRIVAADRPKKERTKRIRFTVGGDRIDYPGDVSTKTAQLTTAKIMFNSVISTEKAKFAAADIKDFYLNTPMERYKYMAIPLADIPETIIKQYNLLEKAHNGVIYVEIQKGMYGLPQAGRIANDKLLPILESAGYHQAEHTPGMFTHEWRPIAFSLVVDDFGIKYVGKEHADHLLDTLREHYTISVDWTGSSYLGLQLDWDYEKRTVDLSMLGYVEKALQRFQHTTPTRPQHAPHAWIPPQYGAHTQLTAPIDTSPNLDKTQVKRLQQIIGVFLYYGRALDLTMLVALGTLAAAQAEGTQATVEACTQLLNYAATYPDAVLRFSASKMVLHIHSDASYLSETKARLRAGGYFYLSDDSQQPPINGAIHVHSSIMKSVLASATEAEVGALFYNAQDGVMLRTTLTELGHPQPATPIQTDNKVADGIVNDRVKQRRSKAIDMRFYWVRDRVRQGQFRIHWKKGSENLADYFTKHHAPAHHREMRPIYLKNTSVPTSTTLPREGVLMPLPATSSAVT